MIVTYEMNWHEFKEFCFEQASDKDMAYRGQANSEWGLIPSYYRLPKSLREKSTFEQVLAETSKGISNHIGQKLSPQNIDEKHKLLSKLQHYGFPTPLLDWTRSPYIAAYFALSQHAFSEPFCDHIGIWILPIQYTKNLIAEKQGEIIYEVIEPDGIYNDRLVSQDGLFTYATQSEALDDLIGSHIRYLDHPGLLQKVNIPVYAARMALDDLRLMGIHAGSMFPGLEGVCRAHKENLLMDRSFVMGPATKKEINKMIESMEKWGNK